MSASGPSGPLVFLLIVEVGRSVGFFFYIDLCMASTESLI